MVSDAYEETPPPPTVIDRVAERATLHAFNRDSIHQCMVLAALFLDHETKQISLADLFAKTRETYGHITTWTDAQMLEVLDSMHQVSPADAAHLEQLGLRKAKATEPVAEPRSPQDL